MEGMMNSSSSVDLRKEVVCFEPMSEIDAAPHANAESIEDLKTRHHRLMVWAAVALIFVFSLLAASLWKLYIMQ